jgi:hypothetical protein
MTNELIQFVRVKRGPKKGQPRGVVMAHKDVTGKVHFGWSFANLKKGDRFDKKVGVLLARGRATYPIPDWAKIPRDVQIELAKISARSVRYFKA